MRTRNISVPLLLLLTSALSQKAPLIIPQQDVTAFVDGMIDIQLKRDDAAGAVILLTQNDTTLISKGYGSADIRKRIPMTDHTIVRGGALTMPIIAVAVMQLVEAKKVSLDADISRYLDFHLAARSDGPITLRCLLTHTAGFAGTSPRLIANDLRTYVTQNLPPRIYPAGALSSYSPYGMDLAAYIVERVSGELFTDYARHHIFIPLGMERTTLTQPLPAPLIPFLSQGYGVSTQSPLPTETLEIAMSLLTTAADMGRFGAMLLHGGAFDGHKVLTSDSVAVILSRQINTMLGLSPEIPSMGLAFQEIWFNGAQYFGQSGDTAAFHVEFEVDPQRNLVLFLAYNSSGHPGHQNEPSRLAVFSRGELIHGIFDRYQPFHPAALNAMPNAEQQHLATGTWIPANEVGLPRNPSHDVHSSIDPADHSLILDRFISDRGTAKHWLMLLPNLWQQYPQDRIYAIRGRNGLPDRLALASNPANQLVRVSIRLRNEGSTYAPDQTSRWRPEKNKRGR